ncbi:MAG TPA: ABC transporter ATP-binding protein [Micropepsaceae bacterium]|nr:ABC transporter ATP-binding protein [Micropepsaceae bacterium]
MTSPALLEVRNLTKAFQCRLAVDNAGFTIAPGEFFSLLGPSGCGKTTLLRLIGGFTVADTGNIHIDGEDVTGRPPEKRPVNTVFQSYAIFPHLNVAENIAYGLRSEGIAAGEREKRVTEALHLISLSGYGRRRPHELSGGERQRVALARALVKRPKLLLLDEPLGALDKHLRESMQTELRQIQREVGIAFLFVTHDQEEALAMSDRIAVMQHGRILQVDYPKKLYERPNCLAVASFIGNMNFFAGHIIGREHDDLIVEIGPMGRARVPVSTGEHFPPGSQVVAAIRPEKFMISRDSPPGEPSLDARVLSAIFLGDRTQIKVAISEAAPVITITAPTTAQIPSAAEHIRIWCRTSDLLLLRNEAASPWTRDGWLPRKRTKPPCKQVTLSRE